MRISEIETVPDGVGSPKILRNIVTLYGESILHTPENFDSLWVDLGGEIGTEDFRIIKQSIGFGLPSQILEKIGRASFKELVYELMEHLKREGMEEEPAFRAIRMWTHALGVSPDPPVSGNAELLPLGIDSSSSAPLFITSTPSGAIIYLENKTLGTTPLSITLSEGVHSIRCAKEGYEDTVQSILIPETTTIDFNLVTAPDFSLSVKVEPVGANIFLDGVYKGTAPLTIHHLVKGPHVVLCSHSGYEEARNAIMVNSEMTFDTHLVEEKKYHMVEIETSPSGAKVFINDKFRGNSPVLLPLIAGKYQIKCLLGGYDKEVREIDVPLDTSLSVTLYRQGLRYSPVARKRAVAYGALFSLVMCLMTVIAYGFIIPPAPPLTEATPQQSAAPLIVSQHDPHTLSSARQAPDIDGHLVSPPYMEKRLELARDNQVVEYVLATPPLDVSWEFVPPMIVRNLCYEDYTKTFICKNVSRMDEKSQFTIKAVDTATGETVFEDGFSPKYGSVPSKTQKIYKSGIYNISIDGHFASVNLRFESNN